MIKSAKYYMKTAQYLGWGEDAKLDKERILLIDQFVLGKKILDVGCGFGLYVDFLSSKNFDATGVDFVSSFIEKAKRSKKGRFLQAPADKLPFRENQFDTTFLFDVLEHGDDKKILTESKRVTKKRILVIVPKKVDFKLEQSGIVFRHYLDKSHLREYERGDLQILAKETGLKLITLKEIHPLYNESIFLSLFAGPQILKKVIRELVFLILPKVAYPTELFALFEK